MTTLQAIFLGILQGLTEFLPVSSSGHLVIAQKLIPNFTQPGILFDVILHAGTTLSILFYFRKRLVKLFQRYLIQIIVGNIPAVFLGLIFQGVIEKIFSNIKIVALALLLTSLINYLTNKAKTRKSKISNSNSLIIGLAQAFAIIPGISRSGATIFSATKLGLEREKAAEFSFLLSIPAVLGANLFQLLKNGGFNQISKISCLAGFSVAFLSGLIAISLVFSLLKEKKFNIFAVYCFILGTLILFI